MSPLTLNGVSMDGVVHAYVPEPDLRVDPSLTLHTDDDASPDPVTYEVIRHRLWNINEEHGLTIQKVSGSPIAKYARDFNPCIMTEGAEYVYFGPYIAMHAGVQDLNARWILEYLAADPGVHEGDMFLCNDPWIGATHQSDTSVLCPVFWDGALFCWVANTLHFADLGGVRAGGWSPSATDVYSEPLPTPPVKIVAGGELRRDVENLWKRRSRVPEMTALDLRALLAGNSVARDAVLDLIRAHGPAIVKAVMRKVIDDAERAFVAKLDAIPDGEWREEGYLEAAGPGDRGTYRGVLTVTKAGDRLRFANAGSDAAAGVLNSTYSGWRSAILAVVSSVMCADSLRAVGGALRHIDFVPSSGALATANHPAAVSSGVIFASANALNLSTRCLAKMLALGEGTLEDVIASGGIGHFPIDSLSGVDQYGEYFSNAMLDFNATPMGAGATADGVHTATPFWAPLLIAPNVEDNEQVMPITYLWRRERRDSGGAGRFMGGVGLDIAFVPHSGSTVTHQIASCGVGIPASTGVFGGLPGAPNRFTMVRGSDVRAAWDAGRTPATLDEIAGRRVLLQSKMADLDQGPDDVMIIGGAGGGGVGDPLEREPARVIADVQRGYVSAAAATEVFGVVLAAGALDEAATHRRRGELRAERLGTAPEAAGRPAAPSVRIDGTTGDARYRCASCDLDLGAGPDGYRAHAEIRERPLRWANALVVEPETWLDDAVVLRDVLCPACGAALEVDVARTMDATVIDVRLGGGPS
jgi:N-methylhydantoinase B